MALALLRELDYRTDSLCSKSWDEFARPGAPSLDFVFTVCDRAHGETCPIWPGRPVSAHWGIDDPAAFEGPEDAKRRLFERVYRELENRIKIFTSLSVESLDRPTLQNRLDAIGKTSLPPAADP